MLGLGETLARRRGLLRAMKSLRGLEDYYRRIDFSVADQTTPRDNRVDVLTEPIITTPTRLRTALFTRLSRETFVRSCNRLLGGWVEKKIVDTIASSLCPAPAALPSCKGDGQRGRCKADCCLGSGRAANILSDRVASDCYSSGLCLLVSDSHSTVLADSCHALRRLRACHRITPFVVGVFGRFCYGVL